MRIRFFVYAVLLLLAACHSQHKHATIEAFWLDFQRNIANKDAKAIADMTVFPLKGAEPYVESFDINGISREQFLQKFKQIFDDKALRTIAATKVNELTTFTASAENLAEVMGVPNGTAIYSCTVHYVFDEGLETQTESAVAFHFAKLEDRFKLAFLLVAG